MTKLTLISSKKQPLKPLVEAAIQNELRLLKVGIDKTKRRIKEYELQNKMATDKFLRLFEQDKLEENLDFAEWIGEYRLLERLEQKEETLEEVKFAD
ncbi:hypothetical protein H8E88_27780 [candidate division KSB1 bacterium]|nr:hypothetical protein [candidate division KSB1 bacterium]MBL7095550.1 hypothetical protein [candidate division KSB1 bacterium]